MWGCGSGFGWLSEQVGDVSGEKLVGQSIGLWEFWWSLAASVVQMCHCGKHLQTSFAVTFQCNPKCVRACWLYLQSVKCFNHFASHWSLTDWVIEQFYLVVILYLLMKKTRLQFTKLNNHFVYVTEYPILTWIPTDLLTNNGTREIQVHNVENLIGK